ncbi:hypothetical protein [Streptomyces sp. NPDC056061]|uniref:hypothetical protein n=1 Tax=Streptomyces sp. NPDC056061 TaxID=3345700 RepID=UPI0035D89FB5
MTLKRSAVAAALAERGDFVSADELHTLLTGRGVRMGLTAVHRALRQVEAARWPRRRPCVFRKAAVPLAFRRRAPALPRLPMLLRRPPRGSRGRCAVGRDGSPPCTGSRTWSTPSSSPGCAGPAGQQPAVDDPDRQRPAAFTLCTGGRCRVSGPPDRRRRRRSG